MFIGETPGADEVARGKPFVGKSGDPSSGGRKSMDQFNPGEIDPAEARKRMREIDARLKEELRAPPSKISFGMTVDGEHMEFDLDESISPFYKIERVIFEGLFGLGHEEYIKFLMCTSIKRHWEYLASIRRRVYEMGNAEGIAAELGIDLEDDERHISASPAPKTTDPLPDNYTRIQEFWNAGYISTKCPECKGPAVWHPEHHGLTCFAPGCGHRSTYEHRPGPRSMSSGPGGDPPGDVRGGGQDEGLRSVRGMADPEEDGSGPERGAGQDQKDHGDSHPDVGDGVEQEDLSEGDVRGDEDVLA
jgi:hypothetical protein